MSAEDYLSLFISLLSAQLPMLVIISLGLWFSISRKAAFPRAAKWACRGFLLLLLNSFTSTTLQVLRISQRPQMASGAEFESYMFWQTMLGLGSSLLFLTGFALVARAVFLDRETSPRTTA